LDILYLLIPLSAVLVLLIIAVFGWAVNNDQFEDLEREGLRVLDGEPAREAPGPSGAEREGSAALAADPAPLDADQAPR
jgi:cbb3-type cytochrome oxidase maturation protein